MISDIFLPADILLPEHADFHRWSVIACDQFTSDADYWQEVERIVSDAPSTLRMILPEYYLGRCDEAAATEQIQQTMRRYLDEGQFQTLEQSFVYLERRLANGVTRKGIVGRIDLESYDYRPDADAPIRATEDTVEERLPPRVRVRSQALLEMPHIMLFLDDAADAVMQCAQTVAGAPVYDFDLMGGGGHLLGRQVSGENSRTLQREIAEVTGEQTVQFAVGDGNHSLAAARKCWLEKKQHLTSEEAQRDPARYALVELVNIHDPAIIFAPIHRVLFKTDAEHWFEEAQKDLFDPEGREITLLAGERRCKLLAKGETIGSLIGNVERFCRAYLARHGGEIDYIHGDDETVMLSSAPNSCGVLLPPIEKDELFSSIENSGPFPRKSFSIGLGPDKRYYLECRKIQ